MNIPEQEIETLLRRAPRPAPPANLKNQLIAQARSVMPRAREMPGVILPGGWFRRWWPALAPGAICVACAAVVTVQQMKIRELKESLGTSSKSVATETGRAAASIQFNLGPGSDQPSARYEEEIGRLKQQVVQLADEVARLEQAHAENPNLRSQIAAARLNLPPELAESAAALAKAKERAESIGCVNNLKQFGLATRIWANDHGDVLPPDILSMSKELNTPKLLVCPADTERKAAADWASFSAANSTYEYLAPSGSDTEPTRVLSRCPIHGNIGLCDGSVQMGVAKNHPEWLIQRDGKLYLEQR